MSSAAPSDTARAETYQRLEFLGDRVLGLAISEMLYQTFPAANEGELSRRLADLVRREACAEVALAWGAGAFIRLGAGEAQTGGRKKTAILADICESLIGAVFIDKGFAAAREVVWKAWRERMLAPKDCAARRQDGFAGMGAGAGSGRSNLFRGRPQRAPARASIRDPRRGRRL